MFELFEIMNEMCEMIYVADIKTHELYFVNAPGRKSFQLNDDYYGQKCYRALQGRDTPCPFCTNHLLTYDQVYSWEIFNPLLKRHYTLKDKLIKWEGKPARIEVAIDTTASENEKIYLQNTVESERVIMDCIRILYQCSALETTLPEVLQKICTFLDAKRTYYMDASDCEALHTFEWCSQNGLTKQVYLKDIEQSLVEKWLNSINTQECYVISDVETLREEYFELYERMTLQEVTSIVITPLEMNGKIVAYIGVDNPPRDRIDNSTMLFYRLRYFLMAAIRRESDEKMLTQLSYHDSLTGAYNRNRYTKAIRELHLHAQSVGIVYMDINGLKQINDKMGHAIGDQVIKLFAHTAAEVFGLPQLYRIGGDEFVVLYQNITQESFLSLVHDFEQRLTALNYSASIGHHWTQALAEIAHGVATADAMMYANKKKHYSLHKE